LYGVYNSAANDLAHAAINVRQVRIFTFLIGREVGDSWQTRWMACSNKGMPHAISMTAAVQHVYLFTYLSI